jgi:radical SAM superfamily enzyme YgiQ (UPF0313 family)
MSKKLKIALISPPFLPNFCRSQRWPVVNRTLAMRYPDWLAYAAGLLEREGFDTHFRDFIAENLTIKDVAEWVKAIEAGLIVLDVTTPSIFNDIECARACKEATPSARIVFVGPHSTVFSAETLKEANGAVDVIARGEYDYTLLELAQAIEGGTAFEKIKGITFLSKDGSIVENEARALIENLDDIPFPAWHHLDVRRYRNNTYLYPFLDQISGRGCPQRCMFCQWPQVMHGRRYRYCSPERVVAEMRYNFERFPIKEIFFEDDTLTTNTGRLRKICELLLQEKRKMVWSCNSRCDFLDFDLMKLMKEAGCRMLLIGPESGSQQILDNVHKHLRLEQVKEFVAKARRAGLSTHACWVIGLPGETKETIEQTIRFAKEVDTDTIQASSVMPLVGTELYQWAVEKGYLKASSWRDYVREGEQTAVMEYPHLKASEMNAAVNRLLKGYYFKPKIIMRLLKQGIRSPSLLLSYMRGACYLLLYSFYRAARVESEV